ncbi:MAG: glycine cleavage system protein GcvH [Acidiferrobacterales bacterium]
MSNIPGELKYTKSHEWVRVNDDGSVTIGITDHAQDLMGDMVYIELPEVGDNLETGKECAVVESVKAASDVYAPLDGEILEVNETISESPEMINQDPYENGWMFRLQLADNEGLDSLLDAKAYEEIINSTDQ